MISFASRRTFLRMCPPLLASFVLSTCSRRSTSQIDPVANQSAQRLPPTPACGENGPTPPLTEGPFYTPDSPERTSLLEPGMTGARIVVIGQVLSPQCTPIANALVDFWHTDNQGRYDNSGYTLRGHQFTDAEGRYRLETIVPGIYPGRTRHFHVKVQMADQSVLTTQLYFPAEPLNEGDFLFRPDLVMSVQEGNNIKQATFDFILEVG
ncbi:MAG: intradiol ring-cleavage dioxygenase [Cyanobacteria bacterium P01_F01_bin.4]